MQIFLALLWSPLLIKLYQLGVVWLFIVILLKLASICVTILRWCLQCVRSHHHAVNPVNCFSHTNTQTKVWWHHVFSTPAVAMLLCNNGLMDQLQTLLASSSSTSPSDCPPSALLCYGHLLLSSLLTLQHYHSTKVPTNIKLCIFQTGQGQKKKVYDLKNSLCFGFVCFWCCVSPRVSMEHRLNNSYLQYDVWS